MGKQKKQSKALSATIALNKKARHDYFIEDKYEAGLALEGWEVKSLREGRVQLTDGYVIIQNNEAYLVGCRVTPLLSASSHIHPAPERARKLLLHRRELDKLTGAVERKGYTLVPLVLYWKRGLVKLEVGLAKGKAQHDKRATEKERDWQREKQRILRRN
ncbi:MAG: SsrA-binding protein SmpB [Gammaproteobacteria bacterium]|nr:SsrA-binding protein SmpB [Gammaproteobacteria bacterium]